MRIALISDLHLDASTAGMARLPELELFLDSVAMMVVRDEIDLVACLGDVFDPGARRESHLQSVFIRHALRIHDKAPLGALWIAGNHDVIDRRDGERPSTVLSPLREVAGAGTGNRVWMPGLEVAEIPELYTYPDAQILALPYMAKLNSAENYEREIDLALERGKRDDMLPLVVLGHLMFEGMVMGSEGEMLRGRDIPFPLARVSELKPALVANGHYHKRERIERGGLSIEIVGAPLHMTFGERDDGARGLLIVEV